MASFSSAAAAGLAGGDGEVGVLGDQSVRGSVNQPGAGGGGGDQDTKMPQEMDFPTKLNEKLITDMEGSQKDVVDILETQIDVKKAHLHQLERLEDTIKLGNALLEKSTRMTQMALLSSSSKLIDGSLAEKSGVLMKVDKSKELEKEVAKLDAEIGRGLQQLLCKGDGGRPG